MDWSPKHFSKKTINLKLDETKYLQGKQHICLTIVRHGLEEYLDVSTRVKELIANEDGSKSVNSTYRAYKGT